MTTQRKEFSASDSAPAVLYAKDDADSQFAYPVLRSMFNPGFSIPEYDEIELSYTSGKLTGVVYKLAAAVQATLTLSYTAGKLTGVVKS